MSEFAECKHCGGELRFVQMDEEHTHKWKAECTQCKTKKGTTIICTNNKDDTDLL